MKVFILANGDPPSPALARRLAAEHDLVFAADGAAHRAVELGIRPDIVCGDFDSARIEVAQRDFPDAEFVRTPDQNRADLEKAILLARERGATSITVAGAGGGRIDHHLGNLALLLRYGSEIQIQIVDDRSETFGVSGSDSQPGEKRLAVQPGDTISVIAVDARTHVTLTGVQWELLNAHVPIGTYGVSNVATGPEVILEVRGAAFLCRLYHEALDSPPTSQ